MEAVASDGADAATADEPEEIGPEQLLGFLPCSGRGCREETGLPCAYVDRRDRCCPTAWCPTHRVVHRGDVYCPVHGLMLGASEDLFTDHHRADLDNIVPLVVNWAARELEASVSALMHQICDEYGQTLVADPVRFVLVGVDRIRTWERAWKMCAHVGVTLRLHIAVEESSTGVVLGKVNSKVAVSLPPPPTDLRERAEDPTIPETGEVRDFRAALLDGLTAAVISWRAGHPPAHADAQARHRRGTTPWLSGSPVRPGGPLQPLPGSPISRPA